MRKLKITVRGAGLDQSIAEGLVRSIAFWICLKKEPKRIVNE